MEVICWLENFVQIVKNSLFTKQMAKIGNVQNVVMKCMCR